MARKKQVKTPPPKFATEGTWHMHHVIFFDDQLTSPAYIALSANAKEVYTILRMQYKGAYTGDTVKCPYSTFVEMKLRRETVARALDQLECYGFIEITRGGLEHKPSEYKLSEKWKTLSNPEEMKKADAKFRERLEIKKKAKDYKKAFMESHTG